MFSLSFNLHRSIRLSLDPYYRLKGLLWYHVNEVWWTINLFSFLTKRGFCAWIPLYRIKVFNSAFMNSYCGNLTFLPCFPKNNVLLLSAYRLTVSFSSRLNTWMKILKNTNIQSMVIQRMFSINSFSCTMTNSIEQTTILKLEL